MVRGLNCGQSDDYPGGYDGYPCQHERFIKQESGQWINRVTYCDGKNDECLASGIIETIANVSLPAPGVVQHDYTDAPLSPQVLLELGSNPYSPCSYRIKMDENGAQESHMDF